MKFDDVIYVMLFFFTISFGFYYRTIRDKHLRKKAGTLVGLASTVIVSGGHCLHTFLTVLVNYVIVTKVDNRRRHVLSFTFNFSYLMFFRYVSHFGLPSPPAQTHWIQMVLTMKLIGLAFEVDRPETDREEEDKEEMTRIEVTSTDYVHYCFSYVGGPAGPYCKYRTFVDYFNYPFAEHAPWKRAALDQLRFVPLYTLIFFLVGHIWPVAYVGTEEFEQRSWLYRYCYTVPMFIHYEMIMFIPFHMMTVLCIIAGFGAYPSFTKPKPGMGPSEKFAEMKRLLSSEEELASVEYTFETVNHVNAYQVNLCMTTADLMRNWNCCFQYWFYAYVYQQFPYKRFRKAVTLLVSVAWHGLQARYYFSIGMVPLMLIIEDLYLKIYPKDAEGEYLKTYQWIHWFYRLHYFAHLSVAYTLVRCDLIFKYYNSVYHVGAIVAGILYVVGLFLLRTKRTKEKKNSEKTKFE